jgi:hypothetical protein
MQTSEQTNIRTNCRWDRTSFRHFDPFARVSFLRKFCSYIPVKMGGSPVNTYQTGFWFWNKNGHDTQTHNDPLNQTGTCLFVGTCRNHGSVGLRTYGFVETLLRHGWVKSMIHDRAQFPYIIKLPQDRVLYELKDLRRRYLTPKINTLNISSEGTTGSIGV